MHEGVDDLHRGIVSLLRGFESLLSIAGTVVGSAAGYETGARTDIMTGGHLGKLTTLVTLASALFESRAAQREKYIEASYDYASAVYKDYINLLSNLRQKVLRARKPEPLMKFLEERRRELLPLRKKLKAVVSEHLKRNPTSKFEAGIIGLMNGSVTVFDRRYFRIYQFDAEQRIVRAHRGSHTVLDLLTKLKRHEGESVASIRDQLLESIDNTIRCLDITWEDISEGYATYRYSDSGLFKKLSRKVPNTADMILAMLDQIQAMSESTVFSRAVVTDFETYVGATVPCLVGMAQDIREIVHDLDNKEPNVKVTCLHDKLEAFRAEVILRFKM